MLSDEQIYECERIASIRHQRHKHSIRGQQITPADDLQWHFARTIEAEVRKQDDALILQMHDAMSNLTTLCLSGGSPLFTAEFDRLIEATTAARARLAGGIFAPENAHLFTVEAALKAFAHVKPLGES